MGDFVTAALETPSDGGKWARGAVVAARETRRPPPAAARAEGDAEARARSTRCAVEVLCSSL